MKAKASRAQWVRCEDCGHEWVGMYWPQPIETAIKLMGGVICPKCAAGAKRIAPINMPQQRQAG